MDIARRGLMLVLSSPSGAGKTSIARHLLETDLNLRLSISATTRPMRPGEVHGRDYWFCDHADFNVMLNKGELLEHARVFDNWYGTPAAPVMEHIAAGRDVLFDIDWQGAQQLRQIAREDMVSVFILPPSTRELERRLQARGSDSAEVVARRMRQAADEISHWAEYDYVIVNDDFERSIDGVTAILRSARLHRARQHGLLDFVRDLREGV
jgi:guanylate kinase